MGSPGVGEVTVIYEDDACDPTDAVTATTSLLGRDVSLMMGSLCSASTLAIVPMVTEDEIPLLNSTSSARDITEQGSEYVFRTQLTSFHATEFLAGYAQEQLGAERVAVLGETSEYGQAASSGFREHAEGVGLEAAVDESFAPEDTDFTAQLRAISQADVDVVGFFGYHAEAARFNEPHDVYAVIGYDSTMLAADAIERAGSADPQAISDAPAATDGWQGLLGTTTFDETGNDQKDPQLAVVEGDRWVPADR